MAYDGEHYAFGSDESLEELCRRHELGQFTTPLARELGRVGLEGNGMIQRALTLGFDFHANDRRTHEPYNYHLARVTLRLLTDLNVSNPTVVTSAPLHDIIEDHSRELALLRFDSIPLSDEHSQRRMAHVVLSKLFSLRVADTVREVSNPILMPNADKVTAYHEYMDRLIQYCTPEAVALKLADFMDNCEAVSGERPQKRHKLDMKQIGIYGLHMAGLNREDHLVVGEARALALELLNSRHEQALVRLEGYNL
jgi:(p)ppGpp synthase/HD superfamily hydrolase